MEQNLLWIIESPDNIYEKGAPTFFRILGRTYDEDLISRILTYVMTHDRLFVNSLLRKYSKETCAFDIGECDVYVYPEKSMGNGRADIFSIIKKNDTVVATITIENKIYSYEHDDQTQTYYDWVLNQQEYKNAHINAFFYLRPSFNPSSAVCKKYINISYTDISEIISQSDYIIDDFKKHISLYLGENTMELNEKQLNIIENYEQIEKVLNEVTAVFTTHKNNIIDTLKKTINQFEPSVKFEQSSNSLGIYSLKLYKDNWYKEDEYYFFTEVLFEGGKMDNIIFQKVIKEYPKKSKEKQIQGFLKSDKISVHSTDGRYTVWGMVEKYNPIRNCHWKEDAWGTDFVEKTSFCLKKYIEETDALIETFLDFAKEQ